MSRIFECTVVDPPTGIEVLERAIAELATGEIELILQPEQQVPRPKNISVQLQLDRLDFNHEAYDAVLNTAVLEPHDYASIVVRISADPKAPATASVVTY